MAPPYGLYGHYEYYFSRQLKPEVFSGWATEPATPTVSLDADPHMVPELRIDTGSVVVLMFARYRAGAEALTPHERGDVPCRAPEGHAESDFSPTRCDGLGHDAINAHRAQKKPDDVPRWLGKVGVRLEVPLYRAPLGPLDQLYLVYSSIWATGIERSDELTASVGIPVFSILR